MGCYLSNPEGNHWEEQELVQRQKRGSAAYVSDLPEQGWQRPWKTYQTDDTALCTNQAHQLAPHHSSRLQTGPGCWIQPMDQAHATHAACMAKEFGHHWARERYLPWLGILSYEPSLERRQLRNSIIDMAQVLAAEASCPSSLFLLIHDASLIFPWVPAVFCASDMLCHHLSSLHLALLPQGLIGTRSKARSEHEHRIRPHWQNEHSLF